MLKFNPTFFIKFTIYLLILRSPLIVFSILSYLFSQKKLFAGFILKIIPFLIFIIMSMLYSIYLNNDLANIFGQARDIFLSIIVALFLIECSTQNKNRKIIYDSLKICLSLIACGKIFIIVFSVITGISSLDIINWLSDAWNINMMKLGVSDSFITRLQIPMDSIVPFMLYFVTKELINKTGSKIGSTIVFILLLISISLTLSRSFWAQSILFIGLAVLLEANFSRIVKISVLSALILSVILFLTPIGDIIFTLIDSRINNQRINSASDAERLFQNNALLNAISIRPLLGHGIGYYIPNAIRSYSTPYLYESQTLSLVMDFGLIGISLLILFFLSMLFFYSLNVEGRKRGGVLFMPLVCFSIWLLSGSVNPFLFGASGGIIVFFFTRFHYIDDFGKD